MPHRLKFYIPHKKAGEKIILLIRRHWFVLLLRSLVWIIVSFAPLVIYFIFGDYAQNIFQNETMYALSLLFLSIYYLFLWLFIFNSLVDYYLDVWIVTNERIVNIEQKQLFSRVVSEHELIKIQDITSEVHGFFPTFLNYGEVFIQTAGERQRFVFKQVYKPRTIKRKIIDLSDYKKRHKKITEKKIKG